MTSVFAHLCQFLDDPQTGWSLGTFGAIAEFNRQAEDHITITRRDRSIDAVTRQGAMRINQHDSARLLPYETLSTLANAWAQGIMVCLPQSAAKMAANHVITDLGEDHETLINGDVGRFFDLGLAIPHIDFCIRTDDVTLTRRLEKHVGTALFDIGSPLMSALQEVSPVRVVRSQLGRAEVYQDIPPATPGSITPSGPHTHLMLDLLAHNRSHAANIPVPDGWLPCLSTYPPNPVRSGDGTPKPFDHQAYAQFQNLIENYADEDIATLKRNVSRAIKCGQKPDCISPPTTRAARTALRIALRQYHHLNGPSELLETWKAVYEPNGRQ